MYSVIKWGKNITLSTQFPNSNRHIIETEEKSIPMRHICLICHFPGLT